MKIYLIKYTSDPWEPSGTLHASSTKALANEYLEYMRTVNSEAEDWFIEGIELDKEINKDIDHLYNIYFWEDGRQGNISSCDYLNVVKESVVAWPGFVYEDPNTLAAIVTMYAKSIEEAKINSIPRYQKWVAERDK